MLALRYAAAVLGVGRQLVALEDQDLVEVGRERTGGTQARHASAEDDGRPAQAHPNSNHSYKLWMNV